MRESVVLIVATVIAMLAVAASSYVVSPPPPVVPLKPSNIPTLSSSTGLRNEVYQWRGQQIRYIAAGPSDARKTALLIHGLFVNADHWRRTINELSEAGYRTYAIDLLGSGYSSKPFPDSAEARLLNGENGRFDEGIPGFPREKKQEEPIRENVVLGTASGGRRVAKQLELRHPLNSCYNFYTWGEQVSDFTRDIIFRGRERWPDGTPKETSLVANSKGTIVALQSVMDTPQYFNGVCAIDPTYREMHHAEMRFPAITMPIVNLFQKFLRSRGKGLYNAATQHGCIEKCWRSLMPIRMQLMTNLSHH
jgi:pimeloyl-ACP methyl ester carboxylesterase